MAMETYSHTKGDMRETQAFDRPRILSHVERVRRFGVECTGPFGDGICFQGGEWFPGGEYIQKLTVKNVSSKIRKLKYKLPDSPNFSMVFPEKIVLPPGMFTEIDVIFRPVHMQVYDDAIYFKVCDGDEGEGFYVPCRALMSTLQAEVPAGLDFGLCPTNETMRYVFQLKNIGEVEVPFKWTCPLPFKLSPMSGVIPVNGSVSIEASIYPENASVYVSLATCEVGKGIIATKPKPVLEMKLSAIGRFTHIVPSQERVDFGAVVVGQKHGATNNIVVFNRSTVPATVKCSRIESDREPVFFMDPTEFVVPPLASAPLTVTYQPTCAGAYTMESYEFTTPGGNRTLVTCSGVAESPRVTCYKGGDLSQGEANSINFRDVHIGKKSSATFFLHNESSLPVKYQVVAEKTGVFNFSHVVGTISGQLESAISIEFHPTQPINYYQRIFVLLENAMPVFFDVMGSGYVSPRGEVKEQRPFPLRHAHVQAARNRAAAGLGGFTPAMLDEVLEVEGTGPLFARKGNQGADLLVAANIERATTRSGDSTRPDAAVAREFFLDLNAGAYLTNGSTAKDEPIPPPVFLSSNEIDFGYVSSTSSGDRRTVTLTNNSHGKVSVQWVMPIGGNDEHPTTAFVMTPNYADIPPGRSFDFNLSFNPTVPNSFYDQELECYVYFKTQRSFRLVKDPTLQPPWCCKLKGLGYTMQGEGFAGQLHTSAPNGILEFPACHVKDATYRTLRLDNKSNLPCLFNFDVEGLKGTPFNVKPKSGIIDPRGFALVFVNFRPQEVNQYRHTLKCIVNNDSLNPAEVILKGESSFPQVTVQEVDRMRQALGMNKEANLATPPLHIKSTCAGLVSSRTVTLHNPSRIPVVYAVEIPAKLSGVFAVTPRVGLLRGNQTAQLTISFSPWEHKEYRLKVNVKVRAVGGQPLASLAGDSRLVGDAEPSTFEDENNGGCHFTVVAEGSGAVVSFDPPNLNFGCLLVNDLSERPITLVNDSDCDVQFELYHRIEPEKKDNIKRLRAGSFFSGSSIEEDEEDDEEDGVQCDGGLYRVPKTKKSPKVPPLLSVDRPSGILPAHSKTLLKATFQPRRSGVFDMGLCALVSGKDEAGNKISIHAEESAVTRVGDRYKLIELLKGVSPDDADFDEEVPLPLSASLIGEASFPTVTVTDVRCIGGGLGASTRQLWSTLALEELNHTLSQQLTKQEVKNNRGGVRDKSKLPGFPIRFIPSPLGTPQAVYVLRLTNPGTLTTSFAIHFPNERDIEVPIWADEGEPNEEQLKENRIIDELKVFECYPRTGTLASGESIAITLTYKYDFLEYDGLHSLALHCEVNQGKQFRLLLCGETLKPKMCRLWMSVPPSDQTFRLMPIALGTTRVLTPLQSSELMNTGDSDLEYFIDIRPLTANSDRPDFFQNLYLENPKGVIPARSTHFLKWRFLPLEARGYSYQLPIYYGDANNRRASTNTLSSLNTSDIVAFQNQRPKHDKSGDSNHINFHKHLKQKSVIKIAGMGYDPRVDDPHSEPEPHPNSGLVPPPYQLLDHEGATMLAELNLERVALGRLPQRAQIDELLILRNPSTLISVDFQWEQTHPLVSSGLLSLIPSKGKIPPGEFITIKLAVDANCTPRVVDTQISVTIKPTQFEEVPKSRGHKSRGGNTSRSMNSFSRGIMPSARSSTGTFNAGSRSVTSAGIGSEAQQMNNIPLSLGPIVSRSTKSRDAMFSDSSSNIMKLTGREPKLPSKPPPPPRVSTAQSSSHGDEGQRRKSMNTTQPLGSIPSTANTHRLTPSQLQQANISGVTDSQLYLSVWFEVVDEESYIALFQGDVSSVNVPRPRTFIPTDPNPEDYVFSPDGSLSIVPPTTSKFTHNLSLLNSPTNGKATSSEYETSSQNSPRNVVQHTHHHRSHTEVATSVVATFFGDLFSDLLGQSEIQASLDSLPKQHALPYYHELREHANLMMRLEKAFRAFDTDGSGKLGIKEIRDAIISMGLKTKSSEVKAFMRSLDHDNDGEVDLKEFLNASMPPEVSLALDDAIASMEHDSKLAKAEERRMARIFAEKQKSVTSRNMAADIAALTIQGNFRARKARRDVEFRRELANNEDLREQNAAARVLQGQLRVMKARTAAKERQDRRLTVMRQVTLGDPDFQGLITDLVEDTLTNMMKEVLFKEFDLGVPPKQYAFPQKHLPTKEESERKI